jgi:RNA-dependent RNA polymerase
MRGADELVFSEPETKRLLATCAYWHDAEHSKSGPRWTPFPWDVAMRELGDIKARAGGLYKTLSSTFYDTMSVRLAPSAKHRH